MKRILALTLTVLLLVSSAGSAAALPFTDSGVDDPAVITYADSMPSVVVEFSDGRYSDLQSWANDSDRRAIKSVDNQTRIAVVSAPKWGTLDLGPLETVTAAGTNIPTALGSDSLAERSWVDSVGLNYELSLAEPVGTLQNKSSHSPPEKFGALSSYDTPAEGVAYNGDGNTTYMNDSRRALGVDNVTVSGDATSRPIAVIDTGTNVASDQGLVFGNGSAGSTLRLHSASKDFIENETVAQNGTSAVADPNGHGTWASSAAVGNYTGTDHDGMAPGAQLMSLRSLDEDGSGSTADIARAIRYAAGDNSQNVTASVISLSLGSPVYSEALESAVNYARENDVVVVAAVGNSRQTTRWTATPSDIDGVLGVAATTAEEPANAEIASFSQLGPDPGTTDDSGFASTGAGPDVGGPGVKTVAKVPGESGVVTSEELSGTSMSTPKIAAVVHLVRAQNPDLSEEEVRQRVTDAAQPAPNIGVTEIGNGVPQADHAIDGTQPDGTQEDARIDAAVTRDETYRSLSDSSGGLAARFILRTAPQVAVFTVLECDQ